MLSWSNVLAFICGVAVCKWVVMRKEIAIKKEQKKFKEELDSVRGELRVTQRRYIALRESAVYQKGVFDYEKAAQDSSFRGDCIDIPSFVRRGVVVSGQ